MPGLAEESLERVDRRDALSTLDRRDLRLTGFRARC